MQCAAKAQAFEHLRQKRRERRIELAEDFVFAPQMPPGRFLARDVIPPAAIRAIGSSPSCRDTCRRRCDAVPASSARCQFVERFRMVVRHAFDLLAGDQQVRRAIQRQFRSQRFAERRIREQRDIDDIEVDRVHMVAGVGQQIERARQARLALVSRLPATAAFAAADDRACQS